MRFEFNRGVPPGCIEWLWNNVGNGNVEPRGDYFDADWGDAWLYERIEQEIPTTDPYSDSNVKYVPTITVKDEKKAILFALRWAQYG